MFKSPFESPLNAGRCCKAVEPDEVVRQIYFPPPAGSQNYLKLIKYLNNNGEQDYEALRGLIGRYRPAGKAGRPFPLVASEVGWSTHEATHGTCGHLALGYTTELTEDTHGFYDTIVKQATFVCHCIY